MGLAYDVEIRYFETGKIGEKLGDTKKKIKDVAGEFDGLGSAFSKGLSGALDVASDIAKTIGVAALAGAAGFAAMGAAVISMNGKLEETQISLASIFQGSGAASSFGQGMGVAATQMNKMRKDAAELPGEFTDLVGIFQTISTNALNGGLTIDETRKMSAQTMAAAAIKGIPMHVAAREMAGLIEGRAGAHNLLGLRLGLMGDTAHKFNKESEEQRIKDLQKLLSKAVSPESLSAFQHSFVGLFSTLKQEAKDTASIFGGPLSDNAKKQLERINAWYNSNKPEIDAYAHHLGVKLANAFEYGVEWFKQYGPAAWDFATNAAARIHDAFVRMEPVISRIGQHIKSFLGDPHALDKLEKVGKLALGARIAAPMAKSLLGFGFDAAMAGGVGSGTGATSALAAAVAAPEVAIVATALAGIGAAALGAALDLQDAGSITHDSSVAAWDAAQKDLAKAGANTASAMDSIAQSFRGPLELVGNIFLANLSNFAGQLAWASKAVEFFANGQLMLANALFYGNTAISKLHSNIAEQAPKKLKSYDTEGQDRLGAKSKVPNTVNHIGKIEIVVQSNQDPSRIARLTVQEWAKIKKNTKNGFVPEFMGRKY